MRDRTLFFSSFTNDQWFLADLLDCLEGSGTYSSSPSDVPLFLLFPALFLFSGILFHGRHFDLLESLSLTEDRIAPSRTNLSSDLSLFWLRRRVSLPWRPSTVSFFLGFFLLFSCPRTSIDGIRAKAFAPLSLSRCRRGSPSWFVCVPQHV